mmetsp:Transcript_15064/g.27127  ORF Transcript_15064/g.27127 Transcript_15064/m.27127 type:complete len:264 (-) Transcript_15064:834-1625(-)
MYYILLYSFIILPSIHKMIISIYPKMLLTMFSAVSEIVCINPSPEGMSASSISGAGGASASPTSTASSPSETAGSGAAGSAALNPMPPIMAIDSIEVLMAFGTGHSGVSPGLDMVLLIQVKSKSDFRMSLVNGHSKRAEVVSDSAVLLLPLSIIIAESDSFGIGHLRETTAPAAEFAAALVIVVNCTSIDRMALVNGHLVRVALAASASPVEICSSVMVCKVASSSEISSSVVSGRDTAGCCSSSTASTAGHSSASQAESREV